MEIGRISCVLTGEFFVCCVSVILRYDIREKAFDIYFLIICWLLLQMYSFIDFCRKSYRAVLICICSITKQYFCGM
jgi:hypothetical protein